MGHKVVGLVGLLVAGAISGCAVEAEQAEDAGQVSAPLVTSCVADAECGVDYVCSPTNVCVRPKNCTSGATGPGMLQGSLTIDAVDTDADMQALGGAWCVIGNVSIKKTSLVDVAALSGLVAVSGTISIEDNAALTSLHGFENLRKAFQISLFRNGQLTSLGALSRLKLLSSLQLYIQPKLTSLDGLQGVTTISWAEVVNNAGLTSLDGLGSVASVYSYLDVRLNPLLTDLTGLNSVASVGNLVQVTDNAKLQSLNGLGNLASIGTTLRVLRNPKLTSFDALDHLTRAKTFSVTDNPVLNSCGVTDLAARVGADCSGCLRNGPCPPPDLCPDDPAKLEPGICGCGVADIDTDTDGAADCVDVCPQDSPNDSDQDGVCNSADACAGFDDHVDADANGIPDGCQACVGAADCDDGNACTTDACHVTECSHDAAQGQSCGAQGTCSAAGECVEPRCELKPLGFLSSFRDSIAFAVSDDGRTVTGRAKTGPGRYDAYRWTEAGGMVSLSYGSVSGRGISADGSVIVGLGGSETSSNMWGFTTFPGYLSNLGAYTGLWDVSANGSLAVGEKDGYAMFLSGNSYSPTVFGSGFGSRANAVSADGSVIVGMSRVNSASLEAFVRTSTGMLGLGDLAHNWYVGSEATAVSPNGQIVVGKANIDGANSPWAGFRWTQAGGMVSLGTGFWPQAVTDSGMIVGNWGLAHVLGSSLGDGDLKSLLTGCGLNLSGWNIVAYDVTPDGRTIVGEAVDSSFQHQAVLIRLP